MKKLLLFFSAVCCLLTANMNGQLVDVFHSETATGGTGGIPAGYSTYRIYARLQDPTDRISAVFGSTDPSPMHHLRIHSSDAANAIWNSGFGGALGSDNNCAFWGFFPDLQHDSYVSIGATSSPADACPDCVGTQGTIFQITNPAGQIATTFAPGGGGLGPDLTVSDGSWFIPNDGSCNGFGQAPDNRILLAQVTIPSGTLEYWLNIAIFDEAIGANQLIYVHTQQEPPQFVGAIPEIDGNCIGLVFPLPLACSAAGCTDPVACNYDPAALVDDGSCTYPGPQPGFCDATGYADLGGACATSVCSYDSFCCTNSWDSLCASEAATDANCAYCVTPLGPQGCTDPGACNYDAAACGDNGTCTYPDGCTDANACNYNAFATCDDGSCIYEACDVSGYSDLAGACATSVCSYDSWCCTNSWDSLCASEAATDANCAYCVGGTAVVGCTDPLACNYNAGATCDDGSCIAATPSAGINCNETGYADLGGACATSVCSYDAFCCNTAWDSLCASEAATDANCAYCLTNASGCTDPAACNYNDLAGCDDGSCTYPDGCTDAAACNYNPAATCNDGSCVYEACDVAGYSDLAGACATSVCSYDSFCCNTSWDSLCAGEAATDANCAYCVGGTAVLGCTDPSACNYDPAATCDDGSCIAGIATPDCDVSGYADLAGACATSVCSYDAFCCNTSWDSICANEAAVDVNCAYCLSSANSTGCTDTAACNYDAYAECSDGSCTYPGCTDAAACNYNAGAGCDDGSCVYPAANDACSGAEALALNSTVTADNSTACGENGPDPGCGGTGIIDLWYSFVYTGGDIEIFTTLNGSLSDSRLAVWDGCPAVPGNYCDQAGYSDLAGACATSVCSYDAWCCSNSWDSICAGEAATDANCAYCLTPLGGGAVIACNDDFIGLASDIYISCPTLTVGNTYYIQAGGFNANTGSFDLTINNYDIFGCNDAAACNYNACATVDDGSCTYPGCTDPAACNYDALAGCDDGSCYYPDGCTDPAACNYNPAALCDDGSCYYPDGCTDPAACNWNPAAICDDGSCDYSCYGCTDPTACNFDGGATIDDGSCTYPPCIANDVPGGAIGLPITMLGSCSLTSVDLSGASDSPESQASGNDLWYSFVAVTSGARIEAHDVSGQDVHVELFDGGMSSVSYENVVGGNGDEYLNVGNLTAGNTYWVSVTGSAMVDVCIQWIPDTRCDYGPGPYNLCSTFKADWVGSNGYTFYFTSTTTLNTYSKYQASPTPGTFCVLSTVPGLTWGDTYDVLISSNWTLSTGSGSESVEVLGDESCSVIVNPQPLMVLRPSDNCANFGPHLLGQTVAAQPFVCAAIDFEWEFTRTDVPELAFTHLRGAANRFLNLNTVPGLVAGATYDVRIRPIFSSGPGAYGAADCLSIVGVGGAAEQVVDNQQAETERLDVSEIASLIYPNPNTGEMVNINLNGIESETVKVRIMDGVGKVVFERTYSVEGSLLKQITFDNPLAAGSYTVNMIAGDVIRTEKMMVQR